MTRSTTFYSALNAGAVRLMLAAVLWLLAGCASSDVPTMRLGSLPYPGPFTLFATAEPDGLGTHAYGAGTTMFNDERSRGILYTCRAGFLDLSHVRDTIDLSRYYYLAFHEALEAGADEVTVGGFSPCRYHVRFDLTPAWRSATQAGVVPDDLDAAIQESALQLAWIATAWYEFLQYYGYRSVLLVSERRSAFTADDMTAHAVGVDVARQALPLAKDADAFNEAASQYLDRLLDELEVVPSEEMMRAVTLVRGKWWRGVRATRRHLEVGAEASVIRPWLVRDHPCCNNNGTPPASGLGEPYPVPPLRDALRPDGEPLAHIQIEMRVWEAGRIRRALADAPERIVPYRDFPELKADVRAGLAKELGEDFDRPYPDAPDETHLAEPARGEPGPAAHQEK